MLLTECYSLDAGMMRHGRRRVQLGFSLIEVMVGLTIGLLVVLVAFQVLQGAGPGRLAAVSGANAAINAALGLHAIERDARNAGYGLTMLRSAIGCPIHAMQAGGLLKVRLLAPVEIDDGAQGGPDTIRLLAGKRAGNPLPARLLADHGASDTGFLVGSDLGVREGDMMLAVPLAQTVGSTWCTAFQATAAAAGRENLVAHASTSGWNPDPGKSIMPPNGYQAGDYLLKLGSFMEQAYSLDGKHLLLTESNLAGVAQASLELYPDIVQLQAVYGRTSGDPAVGAIDAWNADLPASPAQWQRIRALRIALVARSPAREAGPVTLDGDALASRCDGQAPPPAALCWRPDPAGPAQKIDVNIGNAHPDWQHYRYHVLVATIALRNVIWQE
jgi:type IV pilus assembly protein PilW